VFLPGTFTAVSIRERPILNQIASFYCHKWLHLKYDYWLLWQTFFSTTFFNFQTDRSGHIVSNWLWLYFVLTIALSTAVLLWWNITARNKVHEIDSTLGGDGGKRSAEMTLN
jgi:hypothetical protein